jgi:2'-5' RNA ligase
VARRVAASTSRLFVALELPGFVARALRRWAEEVTAHAGGALRAVALESLHVTLCFLGSRPAAEIEAIAAALAEGVGEASLSLRLGEPVWLPPRRPGVLAVQLNDGGGELARLQRDAAAALVGLGVYEPARRPFLAHVTVARVRGGTRVAPGSVALPAVPALESWAEGRVTLFRSRLRPGGSRYEALWRREG